MNENDELQEALLKQALIWLENKKEEHLEPVEWAINKGWKPPDKTGYAAAILAHIEALEKKIALVELHMVSETENALGFMGRVIDDNMIWDDWFYERIIASQSGLETALDICFPQEATE